MAEPIRKGNALELCSYFPYLDYHSTWDTPEAFARHVASIDEKSAWDDAAWERGSSFSGTENMAEALELARTGWKEGVAKIEKIRANIHAMHPVLVKAVRYDIAGSVANVPRAISGNPLNMKANDLSKSRRRPVITLISSMSANCGSSKEAITNQAAVVAAIIDQIETQGYACEVIAVAPTRGCMFNGDGKFKACTSIRVKASNQAVDIGRLSFGLGHASMFRRLVFADWCGDNRLRDPVGRGLGSALSLETTSEDWAKGIYSLPSAEGVENFFKKEDMAATKGLEFLVNKLKEQGCPAFAGQLPDTMRKAA